MAFTLPPLNLNGTGGSSGSSGTAEVGVPVSVSLPWLQTKNYQNHTSGSSQSATSSADQTPANSMGSVGGIDTKWLLLGALAWLALR
jgi:hypothetical protein